MTRDLAIARAALEAAIEKVLAPTATAGVIKGYRHPLDVVESIRALDPAAIVAGVPAQEGATVSENALMDALLKSERELDRLRSRVTELSAAADKVLVLQARVAELEQDAKRYRWLRNAASWPWVRDNLWMPISGAEFDADIDAAREEWKE